LFDIAKRFEQIYLISTNHLESLPLHSITMPRRKRKDPNAPKRAMTAYMLFSQEKRTQIKTDHPTVGFGQVGKLLGEAWAALPEGDKRVSSTGIFTSRCFVCQIFEFQIEIESLLTSTPLC
jgi:hypothetical protein